MSPPSCFRLPLKFPARQTLRCVSGFVNVDARLNLACAGRICKSLHRRLSFNATSPRLCCNELASCYILCNEARRGALMPGGRLTQEDRRRIATWLAEGLAHAEIGRRLSRPTSTITREVNRNRGPAGYQADQAQRATRQRARRRNTAPAPAGASATPPTDGRDPAAVGQFEQRFTEALVQMGMPRMICRVLTCLMTTDSGSLTPTELVRRVQVNAATISKAVRGLEGPPVLH